MFVENPNLEFVCVDNVQFAIDNFTDVDPGVTFVEDCSLLSTEEFQDFKVNIYPNPTTDFLTIQSQIPVTKWEIYNSAGQRVLENNSDQTIESIAVSSLKTGTYFLRMNANGLNTSKTFVKN